MAIATNTIIEKGILDCPTGNLNLNIFVIDPD